MTGRDSGSFLPSPPVTTLPAPVTFRHLPTAHIREVAGEVRWCQEVTGGDGNPRADSDEFGWTSVRQWADQRQVWVLQPDEFSMATRKRSQALVYYCQENFDDTLNPREGCTGAKAIRVLCERRVCVHYFTELTSCACLAYMETLTIVCCLRSARECGLFESEKEVTVCRVFFCHCSSFPSAQLKDHSSIFSFKSFRSNLLLLSRCSSFRLSILADIDARI